MMSRRADATGSTSRAAQARYPGPAVVARSRERESSPKGQGSRFGISPSADGRILPLGADWIEEEHAYKFSLYAQHAESVVLLLFSENDLAKPLREYRLDPRVNKTWNIWHCRDPHRPHFAPRPPDCRAVGCRLGIPARDPVSRAGVVSMERPVPR